jgi:LPXTG-motif cell wall-anchored protein
MSSRRSILVALAAMCMLAVAGAATAQYTVVAVMPDGSAIMRGPDGKVHAYEVPAGTMFNADGRTNVAVADLKPGMKVTGMESGIASWKSTDVMVHQELNAKVVAAAGNSLLIRGSKGTERYEWQNASDITIVKDGAVVDASSIKVGDRITGMIVQKAGPSSTAKFEMAKEEPKAAAPAEKPAMAAAAKPAPKPAEPAPAAAPATHQPAPAPAAAPAAEPAPAKKLPKTGSPLPLLELAGALSMLAGAGVRRLRRS